MSDRYRRVLAYVEAQQWAILPEIGARLREVLQTRVAGAAFTEEEIAARLEAADARPPKRGSRAGAIAVVPVVGVICHRMNLLDDISGGTSSELLAKEIRALVADPAVGTIVLDVDSPGGAVAGTPELFDVLMEARASKRIVAVANTTMASAAYWIAAAAHEIVGSPSAVIGSIGVYDVHIDRTKAEELAGVKTTLISAGKFKVEGNPFEPLSEEAAAAIQADVDEAYETFVKAVATGRGVTPKAVRDGYGQGRAVSAKQAKALGLIDRIDTLDGTLQRLQGRTRAAAGAAALLEDAGLQAADALKLTTASSADVTVTLDPATAQEVDLSDLESRDSAPAAQDGDLELRQRRLRHLRRRAS